MSAPSDPKPWSSSMICLGGPPDLGLRLLPLTIWVSFVSYKHGGDSLWRSAGLLNGALQQIASNTYLYLGSSHGHYNMRLCGKLYFRNAAIAFDNAIIASAKARHIAIITHKASSYDPRRFSMKNRRHFRLRELFKHSVSSKTKVEAKFRVGQRKSTLKLIV